jgi:hypothetical protein
MMRRGGLTYALAAALMVRAADHAAFAAWVVTQRPGWTRVFETGSTYGFIDGGIGLLAGVLLVSAAPAGAPRLLSQLTFVDASGRLATALALRVFPGIPVVLVGTVSLFVAVGASVAVLGTLAMVAWLLARIRWRPWRHDSDAMFDPIAIAALVSFVAGFQLILTPPATPDALRTIAILVSAALAVVFTVASIGTFSRAHVAASRDRGNAPLL